MVVARVNVIKKFKRENEANCLFRKAGTGKFALLPRSCYFKPQLGDSDYEIPWERRSRTFPVSVYRRLR